MALAERLALYRKVEARRKRPLIVYVTSSRVNASGDMSGDAVPEVLDQLQRLPAGTKELDLLIVSNGGDPTVAWRIVSLIRERATKFSALVPQAAYSAATLIVLGADEVVMHPNGNLGPTDPQIRVQRRSAKDGSTENVNFGSEDLMAFLNFSRDQVGLKDPQHLVSVYSKFCDEVTAMGVGVSARSALLSVSLGERLLRLHMIGAEEERKAGEISQKLTKDYLHHGYPVNRSEAKAIGLKIAQPDEDLEDLLWKIWCDISEELKLREPHFPLTVLADNPACQPLFEPVPVIQLPANLPPAIAQQAYQQILNQILVTNVPPAPFETIHALIESTRTASRFVTSGLVVGAKTPDQQLRISTLNIRQRWVSVPVVARRQKAAAMPAAAQAATAPTPVVVTVQAAVPGAAGGAGGAIQSPAAGGGAQAAAGTKASLGSPKAAKAGKGAKKTANLHGKRS